MSSSKDRIYETGKAPAKDWFLQFLVNLANKNLLELDITLTVGGIFISGTLSGVRNYFDDLGTYFAEQFSEKEKSRELSETFQVIGGQCSCISPSEQTEMPSYIHMKNVEFYDAQGKSLGSSKASWWRGRLSEVQGFSSGRL